MEELDAQKHSFSTTTLLTVSHQQLQVWKRWKHHTFPLEHAQVHILTIFYAVSATINHLDQYKGLTNAAIKRAVFTWLPHRKKEPSCSSCAPRMSPEHTPMHGHGITGQAGQCQAQLRCWRRTSRFIAEQKSNSLSPVLAPPSPSPGAPFITR